MPDTATAGGKLPVIIFLHGRSLSGSNLKRVRRYGVIDAIERGRRVPAIVVAPQVTRRSSWQPDRVLSVLDYVVRHYNVDTTRVYVTGMSLGGYGTLHFVGKYPDKVAAAVALCGGGKVDDACNLGTTSLWIQHGKRDRAVPFRESVRIFDAIAACAPRADVTLTLYPKYGHADLARVFTEDTLYNWLFSFARGTRRSDSAAVRSPLLVEVGAAEPVLDVDARREPTLRAAREGTGRSVHVVRRGDTLGSIARRYNTTVSRLCRANGLTETTILSLGRKIRIR